MGPPYINYEGPGRAHADGAHGSWTDRGPTFIRKDKINGPFLSLTLL